MRKDERKYYKLFRRYKTLKCYEKNCSDLAYELIGEGSAGSIIEMDEFNVKIKYIFFKYKSIENYYDNNMPPTLEGRLKRDEELDTYYEEIGDYVIKKMEEILSLKGLKLVEKIDVDKIYYQIKKK